MRATLHAAIEVHARVVEETELAQANAANDTATALVSLDIASTAVVAAPATAPTAKAVAKASGISSAKTIDVEVTDVGAFLRWLLENTDRHDLVKAFDVVAIKARARKLAQGESIPGVTVTSKSSIRMR